MAGVGAPRRKELGLETVERLPLPEEEDSVVVRVRVRVAGGEREEREAERRRALRRRGGHHRDRGEEPRELSREVCDRSTSTPPHTIAVRNTIAVQSFRGS